MIVKIDPSALRRTKWHEYAVRFFFGGLITALAGGIAKEWGPSVAGIFLAFPAIFPASATLLEKQTREKKSRKGLHGELRGTDATAADAMGAALGSIGLFAFALICWLLFPAHHAGLVLGSATAGWLIVTGGAWLLWKHRPRQ